MLQPATRTDIYFALVFCVWATHIFSTCVLLRRITDRGRFIHSHLLLSAVASSTIHLMLPIVPSEVGFGAIGLAAFAAIPLVITAPLVLLLTEKGSPREYRSGPSSVPVAGSWAPVATVPAGSPHPGTAPKSYAGAVAETTGIIVSAGLLAAALVPDFLNFVHDLLGRFPSFLVTPATTGSVLAVTEGIWRVWTRRITRPGGLMSRRPQGHYIVALVAAAIIVHVYSGYMSDRVRT